MKKQEKLEIQPTSETFMNKGLANQYTIGQRIGRSIEAPMESLDSASTILTFAFMRHLIDHDYDHDYRITISL